MKKKLIRQAIIVTIILICAFYVSRWVDIRRIKENCYVTEMEGWPYNLCYRGEYANGNSWRISYFGKKITILYGLYESWIDEQNLKYQTVHLESGDYRAITYSYRFDNNGEKLILTKYGKTSGNTEILYHKEKNQKSKENKIKKLKSIKMDDITEIAGLYELHDGRELYFDKDGTFLWKFFYYSGYDGEEGECLACLGRYRKSKFGNYLILTMDKNVKYKTWFDYYRSNPFEFSYPCPTKSNQLKFKYRYDGENLWMKLVGEKYYTPIELEIKQKKIDDYLYATKTAMEYEREVYQEEQEQMK